MDGVNNFHPLLNKYGDGNKLIGTIRFQCFLMTSLLLLMGNVMCK